ncbi:MAG: hypothetical protein WA160_10415 [Pseudobdellovibrio sp.]
MGRNSAKFKVLALGFLLLVKTTYAAENISNENFSVIETRNFAIPQNENSLSAARMTVAVVPEDFDCPLFSNSPYKDVLNAIDGLQSAINIFPKCDSQGATSTDAMTSVSSKLRQSIVEAKESQDSGETKKLGLSAEKILTMSAQLQDVLIRASAKSKANSKCYESEESRNLIFSMNTAFQSIAPVALDMIAKNPALTTSLAPYLPAVAGAQAVSKGISVLEMAMKQSVTLDMGIQDNREAVIRNTCSFMKVYNKMEYLTLDRALKMTKMNIEFDEKIKISQKNKTVLLNSLSLDVLQLNSDPDSAKVLKIKDHFEEYQKLFGRASDELVLQSGKNASAIGICSVIKTVKNTNLSGKIHADLIGLADLLNKADQIAFKITKFEDFDKELNKSDTMKDVEVCASVGVLWIDAQKEALVELKSLIEAFDSNSQKTSSSLSSEVKIAREDKKTMDLQSNKKKLNLFTDLSVFEPGEVAKRMRGMPKYLFNGPEGGSTFDKIFKKHAAGPVYDLIQDNEKSFKAAFKKFTEQVFYIKAYERVQFSKEPFGKFPFQIEKQVSFYKEREKYASSLKHMSTKYYEIGSYEQKDLCAKSKLAIKAYVDLTDYLISNEYLCKMIGPVLKEPEVSVELRQYCQNSKGDVLAGYKELARPLFVEMGPKTQIELIMQKYDTLSCE